MGIDALVGQEVKEDRLHQYGHAMCMDEGRWLRIVVEDAVRGDGTRKSGRPQKCWIHNVNDDLRAKDFGLHSRARSKRRNIGMRLELGLFTVKIGLDVVLFPYVVWQVAFVYLQGVSYTLGQAVHRQYMDADIVPVCTVE